MIRIESRSFQPGMTIPKKHTKEGDDVSPELHWQGVSENVRELALVCEDPDAPRAEPWVHWVLYRIPADVDSLEEGDIETGTPGKNDFGDTGYGGPMPPPGHGTHHYHFKIYALDHPVSLGERATKAELLKEIRGHVVNEGVLIGTYER